MSKIPYLFETPVPKYFRESGWFDCENMFKFVHWAFTRCSTISHKIVLGGREIILAPYEFVAGRLSSPAECFLTENIFRNQRLKLEKAGLLKKTTNSLTNQFSCYIWVTARFCENDNQRNNQRPTNDQPTTNHKQEQRTTDIKKQTEQREVAVGCLSVFSCLSSVCLSEAQKTQLTNQHSEVDIIRAIAVLKEQKKSVPNVMGFLFRAIEKKWIPKNPIEIELSQDAKRNRKQTIHEMDILHEHLKIKDIQMFDIGDSVKISTHIISYSDPDFMTKTSKIFKDLNLLPILQKNQQKDISPENNGKVFHLSELLDQYVEN